MREMMWCEFMRRVVAAFQKGRRILAGGVLCLMVVLGSVLPVAAATLAEMAGQMILVGFQGSSFADPAIKALRKQVADGRIGGVMYLKHNISTLDGVVAINSGLNGAGAALPPFIAIDQEGGSIERLTRDVGFREIQSAADIGRGQTPESARRIYTSMARDLAELGFNLNLGPVADLNVNPNNPIIARYGRSFGRDAGVVAQFSAAFILAHHRAGVMTALKHFPGHGSSSTDSHKGFVDVSDSWQAEELEPYRTLVQTGGVDMVMVGHLFHEKFLGEGQEQLPASLSPVWITGVLRQQLGHNGVVISDDMEMSAIRTHYGFKDAILRAVRAGTDILLFSNTANYRIGLPDEVLSILVTEARADPAFKQLIEASYARILALKQKSE